MELYSVYHLLAIPRNFYLPSYPSYFIHTPSVTSFYVQENFAPVTVHVSAVSANVTRMPTVNTLDGTVKTARHVRENVRN